MRKTLFVLASAGLLGACVISPSPVEAGPRRHIAGLATFAYDWTPDYGYYRSGYYGGYRPVYYSRYIFDKDLAAPYACCGYTTTTFYTNTSGFRNLSQSGPSELYYRSPYPAGCYRRHHDC
jgi:hypothetical protein